MPLTKRFYFDMMLFIAKLFRFCFSEFNQMLHFCYKAETLFIETPRLVYNVNWREAKKNKQFPKWRFGFWLFDFAGLFKRFAAWSHPCKTCVEI